MPKGFPFREALLKGPLVFDGAMGTLLYDRGVYFDRSFEELCLTQPALICEVHKAYIDIGVDVIQTNSYGANAIVLKKHNLEDKTKTICKASVQLAKKAAGDKAYVVGSIGPTQLLPKDLIHSLTRKKVFNAFREAITALVEEGVDGLVFETFRYLGELEIAIEAAYGVEVPLIAQASFDQNQQTGDGASVLEFADRVSAMGVDAIGANCILGPEQIHLLLEELLRKNKPVVVQPNVGFPKNVEGRSIYQASPETFGVCAKRAFKLGVVGYGGCCGTNPDYIRRVVASARMFGRREQTKEKPLVSAIEIQKNQKTPEEKEARSLLAKKLSRHQWIVSIEILPPIGTSIDKSIEQLKLIEKSKIAFVNVPDGPRATVRMSNLAFCKLVREHTLLEPLLHVCGRDKNLLALQGNFLGAQALGIKNMVVVTGDPPKIGDYPHATAVFDLDSVGMLSMANGLNAGMDLAGKPTGSSTDLVLLTGAEPHAACLEKEIERLFEKKEAGAEAVMTQPVYNPKVFEKFLKASERLKLPIIMGVLPLGSAKNAWFLHQNVPGMQVPEDVLKRMSDAESKIQAQETGVQIAVEAIGAVRNEIQGVYLMPSLGRVQGCLEVVQRAFLNEI